jgi:hypothetical protein
MTPELGNVLPDNISHKHSSLFCWSSDDKKRLIQLTTRGSQNLSTNSYKRVGSYHRHLSTYLNRNHRHLEIYSFTAASNTHAEIKSSLGLTVRKKQGITVSWFFHPVVITCFIHHLSKYWHIYGSNPLLLKSCALTTRLSPHTFKVTVNLKILGEN